MSDYRKEDVKQLNSFCKKVGLHSFVNEFDVIVIRRPSNKCCAFKCITMAFSYTKGYADHCEHITSLMNQDTEELTISDLDVTQSN